MGAARFVFIADGVDAGHESSHSDQVWWRLVAANNRVLGRSVGTIAGEDAARDRAAQLCARIDDAVSTLATVARGQWAWTVSLDGVERASCAHPFPRRVDCVRTLALFQEGLREADPTEGALRYFANSRQRAAAESL